MNVNGNVYVIVNVVACDDYRRATGRYITTGTGVAVAVGLGVAVGVGDEVAVGVAVLAGAEPSQFTSRAALVMLPVSVG